MTTQKPKASSGFAQSELDKAEKQFEKFDQDIKELTAARTMEAPKEEAERQTQLSSREVAKTDIYLKPKRQISSREKFNPRFEREFEYKKEKVKFIAENKEIIGESIEIWTKPFPGLPAEEWSVPVNKPVWGPRYLADQIKRKYYHRLVMKENVTTSSDGMGQYYGSMAADTTIQRLDAYPVNDTKSVFMGKSNF